MKKKHLESIVLLFMILLSTGLSQSIDFSVLLTYTGGVHSPVDFVVGVDGSIYVAGGTREGLPVTENAFQKVYNGHNTWSGGDAYLMKLSPEGDLIYATYIGGRGGEESIRIALDSSGYIYVCGSTWSDDFPVTDQAFQTSKGPGADNFIIKFSPELQMVASTFLGGNGFDYCSAIMIANQRIYLTGRTNSSDFPVTKDALDREYYDWKSPDPNWQSMIIDFSLAVLSLDLDTLLYATYLGGKDRDEIVSVTPAKNHNLILTGITWSDDYPTTPNCFDSTLGGQRDGFVTILNPDLTKILYSTLIGGQSIDDITNMAEIVDSNGLLLSGNTNSSDFPITSDARHTQSLGGESDGFIMKFDLRTYRPVYSSLIGGTGADEIKVFTMMGNGNYLLIGQSQSPDYPVTPDALDPSFNGGDDMVLTILGDKMNVINYSTFIGGSNYDKRIRSQCFDDNTVLISLHSISPDFPMTKQQVKFNQTEAAFLIKLKL